MWLNYPLSAITVLSFWLAGSKNRNGWLLALGNQALWLVYSVWTHQWGFLASCAFFAAVYIRNYVAWGNDAAHTA